MIWPLASGNYRSYILAGTTVTGYIVTIFIKARSSTSSCFANTKTPSGFSTLYKSKAGYVAMFFETDRLPLNLGKESYGEQSAHPFNEFNWKVINT